MGALVRVAIGLVVLAVSGCFSTEITYNLKVNVTEAIEKQEQQVLNQFQFGKSDSEEDDMDQTEADLRAVMRRGSCDQAFVAYLILQEPDPSQQLKRLPDKLPLIAKPSEYAPGNPNKCKDRNVQEWLEQQIVSNAPLVGSFFMPRKQATQIDSDVSSLSLEQVNKCIDLTENPKYLRLRDLDLQLESNSDNFPKTTLSIHELPDNDIRKHGLDWRPSAQDMKALRGSLKTVATTSELTLVPGGVHNTQLQWKSDEKESFLNGLLAKENAALFEVSGIKLKQEKDSTGKDVIIKPSGTINFKIEVEFHTRIYGTQLSYCGPLIPKILAR
ncbi:MAG: hypothetical protein AAF320_03095 [Myxococcota bacterium]